MARYYNADTLIEFMKQNTPNFDGETTMQCVERAILEATAADVVEVKHGKWTKVEVIGNGYGQIYYQHKNCTVNSTQLYKLPFEYCPRCGAKMDGKGNNVRANGRRDE